MFCICFSLPTFKSFATHNERTRVLCRSTLMWCSLHVIRGDQEHNVRALHVSFLCSRVQHAGF